MLITVDSARKTKKTKPEWGHDSVCGSRLTCNGWHFARKPCYWKVNPRHGTCVFSCINFVPGGIKKAEFWVLVDMNLLLHASSIFCSRKSQFLPMKSLTSRSWINLMTQTQSSGHWYRYWCDIWKLCCSSCTYTTCLSYQSSGATCSNTFRARNRANPQFLSHSLDLQQPVYSFILLRKPPEFIVVLNDDVKADEDFFCISMSQWIWVSFSAQRKRIFLTGILWRREWERSRVLGAVERNWEIWTGVTIVCYQPLWWYKRRWYYIHIFWSGICTQERRHYKWFNIEPRSADVDLLRDLRHSRHRFR